MSWASETFTALYGFDSGGHLASITLRLSRSDHHAAETVKGVLLRMYGTPQASTKDAGVELVVWMAGHEQVGFIRLTDPTTAVGAPVTSVNYQPLSMAQ